MAQSREEKLAKQRAYNNSPAGKASQARYLAKAENRAVKHAATRRWEKENPEPGRARARLSARLRAGIVDPPAEARRGTCPICKRPDRELYLDHDYTTGAVRGWICCVCNSFIGRTDAEALARAEAVQAYIKKAS